MEDHETLQIPKELRISNEIYLPAEFVLEILLNIRRLFNNRWYVDYWSIEPYEDYVAKFYPRTNTQADRDCQ